MSDEAKRRRAEMRAMWDAGYTHTAIAEKFGITKERVGQLLGRVKLEPVSPYMWSATKVAKSLSVNPQQVRKWVQEQAGAIRTGYWGSVNVADVVQHYAQLYMRPCRICGQPCESWYAKSCPKHRGGAGSYESYPIRLWSDERKAKHSKASMDWQRRNNSRYRLNLHRARMVYQLIKKGVEREEAQKRARERYPYPK